MRLFTTRWISIFFASLTLNLFSGMALSQESTAIWLSTLRQEALDAGISVKTTDATIQHIELLPNVLTLDTTQPEFVKTFLSYYRNHINDQKIARGKAMLVENQDLLNQIEAQYKVPKSLIVAFWGMETDYGRQKGNVDTFSALATLAHDGRRSEFFHSQLLDAMRMVDAGNAEIGKLKGSWAGAFGHMQFMPATFIAYAVDGNGDGRIDVVNTLADAFASAANYLSQIGWNVHEPAMIEVQLPNDFKWSYAQLNSRRSIDEWSRLGVKAVPSSVEGVNAANVSSQSDLKLASYDRKKNSKNKSNENKLSTAKIEMQKRAENSTSSLPKISGQAAIVLPQGWQGPAFMVFSNFDVVMNWNRSVLYALTVAQLVNELEGQPSTIAERELSTEALSFQQMRELQALLNAEGFDVGEPDGIAGTKTQAAVRGYQLRQNLPADGYADLSLYEYIKQNH